MRRFFDLCLAAIMGALFALGGAALAQQQGTGTGIPSGPAGQGGGLQLSPAAGAQMFYTTPYQPRGNPGDYVFGRSVVLAAAPGFAALTAHVRSGLTPGSCKLVLIAGSSNREYVVPVVGISGTIDLTGSVGQGC